MTVDASLELAYSVAIATILRDPSHAGPVFARARVEEMDPPFRDYAEAINGLRVRKAAIDALSVVDEMTRRGTIGRIGGPAAVMAVGAFIGDVDWAVDVIVRTQRLRRAWRVGEQTAAAAMNPDADPLALARSMQESAQSIIDGIEAEGDVTTPSLREFLDRDDPPFDWVVPGLLERGDRLILTGAEGLGKSVLMRQLAVCAAAGVHPFTHRKVEPARVLVIDCENGPVKLRRALRPLVHQAQRFGVDPSENMHIEAIPAGLDLTKGDDEMWLSRVVSAIQPDLLITGPVYRLHAANPNDEEPARKVTQVLDRCRAAANCALITEAHAGHGYGPGERPVRPTGSSLWLRWPEFGYGLRAASDFNPESRVVDFVPWRGDREARDWPKRLRAGGAWPWVEDHTASQFGGAA